MKNLVIVIVALTLLTSCGKEGPVGPQGAPGNANVMSYVYNVTTWSIDLNAHEVFSDLPVPEITNSVLSGGTVQVFEGNLPSGSNIWYGMPYSYQSSEISFDISYGNVRIIRTLDNGSTPTPPSSIYQYKVVIIPPA